MGMYTELVIKCSIKDDAPEDVLNVLRYLFTDKFCQAVEITVNIDHPLFKTDRWRLIGKCFSYYHHPKALSDFHEDIGKYLFSRSDIKNYGGEIAMFIEWLMPYIDEEEGHCIGWEWYEEDETPTLLKKIGN